MEFEPNLDPSNEYKSQPEKDIFLDETPAANIEVRCPQCLKLYCVSSNDIHSNRPSFECRVCLALFAFEYPPRTSAAGVSSGRVVARTLKLPQVKKLSQQGAAKSAPAEELKSCPKCHSLNPRTSEDCFKCGIVFSKYSATGERASLMKAWRDIFDDYTSVAKHFAFVDRCEELHALPYALKKYKDLREAQPHDPVAREMVNSIMLKLMETSAGKATSRVAQRVAEKTGLGRLIFNVKAWPWARIVRLSPVSLGMVLIVVGITRWGAPNLVGAGAAVMAMSLGMQLFFRGRLHWHDLWY